jgi:hypothetical protein
MLSACLAAITGSAFTSLVYIEAQGLRSLRFLDIVTAEEKDALACPLEHWVASVSQRQRRSGRV